MSVAGKWLSNGLSRGQLGYSSLMGSGKSHPIKSLSLEAKRRPDSETDRAFLFLRREKRKDLPPTPEKIYDREHREEREDTKRTPKARGFATEARRAQRTTKGKGRRTRREAARSKGENAGPETSGAEPGPADDGSQDEKTHGSQNQGTAGHPPCGVVDHLGSQGRDLRRAKRRGRKAAALRRCSG